MGWTRRASSIAGTPGAFCPSLSALTGGAVVRDLERCRDVAELRVGRFWLTHGAGGSTASRGEIEELDRRIHVGEAEVRASALAVFGAVEKLLTPLLHAPAVPVEPLLAAEVVGSLRAAVLAAGAGQATLRRLAAGGRDPINICGGDRNRDGCRRVYRAQARVLLGARWKPRCLDCRDTKTRRESGHESELLAMYEQGFLWQGGVYEAVCQACGCLASAETLRQARRISRCSRCGKALRAPDELAALKSRR